LQESVVRDVTTAERDEPQAGRGQPLRLVHARVRENIKHVVGVEVLRQNALTLIKQADDAHAVRRLQHINNAVRAYFHRVCVHPRDNVAQHFARHMRQREFALIRVHAAAKQRVEKRHASCKQRFVHCDATITSNQHQIWRWRIYKFKIYYYEMTQKSIKQ